MPITFVGTSGADTFTGLADLNTASGAGGNDSLMGGPLADILSGGPGSDTLDGGAGDDMLFSGDRSPTFNLPYGGNAYVLPLMDTGAEPDTLRGGDGSDRIFAGYGDSVDGGPGGAYGDYLYISFQGAPAGVSVDFSQPPLTIGGGVITGIENISYVQGSQFGDRITLSAGSGSGYADNDVISGMDGNDTLTAGYYTGTLFGDAGDDVLDGRPSAYLSSIDGGAGADTIYAHNTAAANGGAGNDIIYAEALVHGGTGNDTIVMQNSPYGRPVYGDEGDDQITAADSGNQMAGGAGADTLTGGAGTDTLYSADFGPGGFSAVDDIGLEHDRLSGGGGDDTLAIGYGDDADGGAGTDTLRMVLTGATRAVSLDTAAIVSGGPYNFAGGVIQNIETVLSIRGTDFADSYSLGTQPGLLSLDAGGGDDTITSHGSATSILGGAGDDRLISGSGADSFDGGSGIDTIDYSAAAAGVSVNMKTGAGAGGDTFTHVEAAVGSAFADTLVGTAAGAMLSGGAGDDRLEIGARDVATLGAGADLVFVTPGTHSGAQAGAIVTVTDWTVDDHLQFGATTGAYTEISAASFTAAAQAAEAQENAGYNFVAVQVQSDVYLFGSPIGRLHFDDAVRLVGTTLDTVSAANVGLPGPLEAPVTPSPPPPPPASVEPTLPAAPSAGIGGGAWTIAGDADHAHLRYVLDAVITAASTTHVQASIGDVSLTLDGFGFATDASGHLSGGTATSMTYSYGAAHGGPFLLSFTGEQVPLGTLATFALNDDINYFFLNVLPGGDRISGSSGADVLRGYDGDDVLIGGGGADTLGGGFGNDVLYAEASPGLASAAGGGTYLRGDSGDDYIIGSRGFDDANGNMGNDTISTGAGDDYSVGGQGSDLLFGDAGNDIVWGNLGNDTCVGGEGNDQVRGGQGDDVLYGGAGNDFISGDRGNDTETGGAGADIFHTSQDAGIDRVLDFRLSEGDRVQLDPGTTYTLAQVGDDAVIDLGGGNQMILVGVSTLSLTPGWIFGA